MVGGVFGGQFFREISDEKKWSPEVCLEVSKVFFCLMRGIRSTAANACSLDSTKSLNI